MHYKIVFVIPSVAIPLAAALAAFAALVVVYARTTNVLQVEDIAIFLPAAEGRQVMERSQLLLLLGLLLLVWGGNFFLR